MKFLFSILTIAALLIPFSALAEEEKINIEEYFIDATTIEDKYSGQYVRITPQSLADLYWRLQVFDSGDNRAIDNYMLINECDIYQDNFNNDFEWNKIREAAKQHIKQNKNDFSTKFEFFVPVHLGRYDTEKKGFDLVDDTGYRNIRRMEVNSYVRTDEICGESRAIKDYPMAVLFILEEALTYVFSEVDEHVAQAYILRKQKEILDLPIDLRQRRYERTAYLRFRLDIEEYQGNIISGSDTLAVLKAELDGVDLFEDAKGKRLLSSTVFRPADQSAAATQPEETIESISFE